MGLRKGQTNNPHGRPKGIPNKTTEQIRLMLKDFIENNIEDLQAQYDQLEPKEKLMFFDKLLSKILPQPLHELEKLSSEQLDEIILRLKNRQYEPQNN